MTSGDLLSAIPIFETFPLYIYSHGDMLRSAIFL